ncbi:carbamoyl-phosphate synthase, small subunit [Gracilibacillus halophilus YIM-C55.5]|uniref:Carbamoyl phosphate synthase small chain n=1 Tax=Gracilibacillus halophilus YIM-C55.5 TaxID=1308866 RepID=N4W884_9BACI|nr:carbamoyl phosphate synthase small subunit [Gracilibacillus halophilus]ENH96483.1 carbamoyl-phosphate synthase, small subunit [Gracilibacillus halophilus YIM-C55.5]
MQDEMAYLVLNTGDVLEGKWLSSVRSTEGELVFNTAMTGYQEVMTDPSYADQIVTMTYPLIGNYGCNDIDYESLKPYLAGFIVSTASHNPEHYESKQTLQKLLDEHKIPALSDIDTRALTRIIREHGEVYGKITADPYDQPDMSSVNPDIVSTVSVTQKQVFKTDQPANDPTPHVVLMDFGYKHSIAQSLLALGCDVTVVPYHTSYIEIQSLDPDGVLLSNGPGDPKALSDLLPNIKHISEEYPTLGICLGHQLVALAHGATTKRLPYGHRGSNHPVKDLQSGKVMITSQNHGYVVDYDSVNMKDWYVSHVNVNDQSVEGLKHQSKPLMTVQFHPEAHPGPIDTHHLFVDFIQQFITKGEKQHA